MDLPDPLITISPNHLSGVPIFTGTRVSVQALLDYIEGGDPPRRVPAGFPERDQRTCRGSALEMAQRAAVAEAAKDVYSECLT